MTRAQVWKARIGVVGTVMIALLWSPSLASADSAPASPTFTKHIAPILQEKCQACHRPGQIGPMPLLTYWQASAWSETIKEVIDEGRMPPWHADPGHGRFANDRRLPK